MKGIAATALNGEVNFFWLDSSFAMHGSFPSGLPLFGGSFTSPPVAVTAMALHSQVIATGGGEGGQQQLGEQMRLATTPAAPAVSGPATAAGAASLAGAPATGGQAATGTSASGGSPAPTPDLTIVGRDPLFTMMKRIDLFGLGTNYAMYHKRYYGEITASDTSAWTSLGGVFTSAPAAIAWGTDRVDVFGIGTDHQIYQKTANGDSWSVNWVELGGTFTSAASLVVSAPNQLNLFARGNDFTLRGNYTDGTSWFGFQNHGGNLASPPVAVSWGANRIDVFAIFNGGALNHIWWDGQIWNDWESLGGSYVGEPAAVSWGEGRLDVFVMGTDNQLHHHWFTNNTWAVPEILNLTGSTPITESPTAVSTGANKINLFIPTTNNEIVESIWNGQNWGGGTAVSGVRLPWRYEFLVDYIRATTTRSLITDTDGAVASVAPGNGAVLTATQWVGDIGSTDEYVTNLLDFVPVTVDLAEPMSFSYQIVNNGHADQSQILAALASGSNSLGLAATSSMEQDIAQGIAKIVQVTIEGATKISIPVVGSVLGAIESWLLGQLTSIVFANCDGVVAVEVRAMMGSDLLRLTSNGTQKYTTTTTHQGTNSPDGCGSNSVYEVTWSIRSV